MERVTSRDVQAHSILECSDCVVRGCLSACRVQVMVPGSSWYVRSGGLLRNERVAIWAQRKRKCKKRPRQRGAQTEVRGERGEEKGQAASVESKRLRPSKR